MTPTMTSPTPLDNERNRVIEEVRRQRRLSDLRRRGIDPHTPIGPLMAGTHQNWLISRTWSPPSPDFNRRANLNWLPRVVHRRGRDGVYRRRYSEGMWCRDLAEIDELLTKMEEGSGGRCCGCPGDSS
ncbi:hypothetical protein DOTSEDRAFT_72283 [Dothistroma septosporum NZE10]|uniref:Uncharacterized protein n=1 Tax=Dothistroma septosporum (strain NZE10 / CBS 128990) TaxID=675120 RepID=N1PPC4_DOTSN|nr:hypothetical protein DOTSEDRAFT_72283 [Dothistroma septosporum NZE10]